MCEENFDFEEIQIDRIEKVPSLIEVPIYGNPIYTQRSLCALSPENKNIIPKLESLFTTSTLECNTDIFTQDFKYIKDPKDLLEKLSELLIRFDTLPKNYTKKDYEYLTGLLCKTLLYIYNNHPLSVITNEWSLNSGSGPNNAPSSNLQESNTEYSDSLVPSEKLVKEALDALTRDKQDKLIPGLNLKTLNGQSLLEPGDMYVNPYRFRFMSIDEYDALQEKDPDLMYFIWEDEESENTSSTWKFGDRFPIVFGTRSTWKFGDSYPLKF